MCFHTCTRSQPADACVSTHAHDPSHFGGPNLNFNHFGVPPLFAAPAPATSCSTSSCGATRASASCAVGLAATTIRTPQRLESSRATRTPCTFARPAPSPALHLRLVLGAFGPYLECSHCTLPGAGFCPECLPLRRSCADRYALLRIETNLGDKKFDLMKLRNPHGQGGQEWAGNWCGSLEPSRQPCTTTCALALCETQYLRPDEV